MARFFDAENGEEFYFEEGNLVLRLNEENLFANIHEIMDAEQNTIQSGDSVYDRIAILDPRDDKWYQWWRYDQGDEKFDKMEYMARRVGTVLIRQTVMPNIQDKFMESHALDDSDFEQLLGHPEASA